LEACITTGDPSVHYGCIVTTFAGGEQELGDGGIATQADLAMPTDVLVAGDGTIYIADSLHNRIRVVDTKGMIATLVGTGPYYGNLTSGLPSTETPLRRPAGLAFGPDGLLYFLDNKMHIIGRIEQDGSVRAIIGDGRVANAAMAQPTEIVLDSAGNIYIADTVNNRVRRLTPDGVITTVVGSSDEFDPQNPSSLDTPQALAIDSQGRLFVGHRGPMRIYDTITGELASIFDERLGTTSIAISAEDEIYFANTGGHSIAKFSLVGTASDDSWLISPIVTVVGGSGVAGFSGDGGRAIFAQLNTPYGIALDDKGNLYIADTYNHRIRRVGEDGIIQTVAGGPLAILSSAPTAHDQTSFNTSNGMTFDSFGNLFVADYDLNLIRRVDTLGYVSLIAGTGITAFAGDGGHPFDASLNAPRAPVFDQQGNLLFIDESNDSQVVRRIVPGQDGVVDGSQDEIITTVIGIPGAHDNNDLPPTLDNVAGIYAIFASPRGMDFDSKGNLIIADTYSNHIVMVTPGEDGVITGELDEIMTILAGTGEQRISGNGGLAIEASTSRPNWVDLDSRDNIYFLDGEERVIRWIDRSTGQVNQIPNLDSVAMFGFDDSDNLYYSTSSQIFRIDAQTHNTSLILGNCIRCGWLDVFVQFDGDGEDARNAPISSIWFFAIDSSGNLIIDDSSNGRLRKVTFVPLLGN
jgi:sugar lactone lactonase YvrE